MLTDIEDGLDEFVLDPSSRGVPPGFGELTSRTIAVQHWHPSDGAMSLPLLSLDLAIYDDSRAAMFDVCAEFGIGIAPHAKTPMAPALARNFVEQGAWGTSVADLRQAGVMLRYGLRRLLIANEIGGLNAIKRLAQLLSVYRDAEIHLFVDSVEFVQSLAAIWAVDKHLPTIHLLLEVGCGRGGVQTQGEIEALLSCLGKVDEPRLQVSGVAAYEGTTNRPNEDELQNALCDLFDRVGSALRAVREFVGPDKPLLLSAGGSSLFDYVIVHCVPMTKRDGNTMLLLRNGACFFSDHGPIRDRLQALASRKLLGEAASLRIAKSFRPALRLWAEVLSTHSDGTVICGLGLRDAAHDQGLPVPFYLWREGRRAADINGSGNLTKLNDQHAFVQIPGVEVQIGDVVEFGVRHPCTTIDKHDLIYGIGENEKIQTVFRTFFG